MRFFIRHILNKDFPKNIFGKGVQLYFEISLFSFIRKIFEQKFYLFITVYLVRIWTYKNANEKAHTFSRRSKIAKKKRTKTDEKRIPCKFTLSSFYGTGVYACGSTLIIYFAFFFFALASRKISRIFLLVITRDP